MNYKEYFKQQLVESIMETFAEIQASHGDDRALQSAKYFKSLMGRVEDRRAKIAADGAVARADDDRAELERRKSLGPTARAEEDDRAATARQNARKDFTSNPRVRAMSARHMGTYPQATGFNNPVEAGVLSPESQKSAELDAAAYGRGALERRRAAAQKARERAAAEERRKKFTI